MYVLTRKCVSSILHDLLALQNTHRRALLRLVFTSDRVVVGVVNQKRRAIRSGENQTDEASSAHAKAQSTWGWGMGFASEASKKIIHMFWNLYPKGSPLSFENKPVFRFATQQKHVLLC